MVRNVRNIFFLLCAILLFSIAQLKAVEPEKQNFALSDVIPRGIIEVEILTLQYTKRAEELTVKFSASARENRDWLLNYVKTAPQGPLPYHPKLGLTEKEYAEYLSEVEKRTLVVATNAQVLFRRDGDVVTVRDGAKNSPLAKLRLNIKSRELEASVGKLGQPKWNVNERTDTPLGFFEGYRWRYEKSDLDKMDITIVSRDILRLKKSGKIVWRLKDNVTAKGTPTQQYDVLFQYTPPSESQKHPG
ncbi:MAG TPA: hypothetical protein VK846_05320 [Candidatus Limnocylindria bacterium]|nr:hypothetical protein [Candidatus Limnocylindria bacterium]